MASSEPSESLAERATRLIGAAIVRGDHAPGGTLPVEAEMCRSLGVSRNVLREAVKTLAGKGFLRTVRRAGTIVQPRNAWNLLDPQVLAWSIETAAVRDGLLIELTQLRAIIEPEAAALAARHATATEIEQLLEACVAMERHAEDRDLAIEADVLFHERLFLASHNDLLVSLLRAFIVLLREDFALTMERVGGYIRNLEQHRTVAEAVARRNAKAARAAMRQLLANNEADLAAILAVRQMAS